MNHILVYISLFLILNSCQQGMGGNDNRNGEVLLASVENKNLYLADVSAMHFRNKTPEDSLAILKNFVNDWIDEEIFSLKAKEKISNLNEITFEADNYTKTLISAAYEKQLLSNFDLELTQDELVEYYNEHKEFFVFEEPYYDINYILLPRTTKNLAKIKKAITDGSENHWLDNYCAQEPKKCVIKNSRIEKEIYLKDNLKLQSNKLIKNLNYNYQYISADLVAIYKVNRKYNVGDIAPMEIVEKELTNLAMHKKKQDYLKEIKEKTIQKAKNDKIFEKYIN